MLNINNLQHDVIFGIKLVLIVITRGEAELFGAQRRKSKINHHVKTFFYSLFWCR